MAGAGSASMKGRAGTGAPGRGTGDAPRFLGEERGQGRNGVGIKTGLEGDVLGASLRSGQSQDNALRRQYEQERTRRSSLVARRSRRTVQENRWGKPHLTFVLLRVFGVLCGYALARRAGCGVRCASEEEAGRRPGVRAAAGDGPDA